ncbi:hypothetical protein DERF_005877 [Dermatophagoides farinae]|uniref:Uncharacterized protein n=1 Tax=Dermatophagoides farinae TaxID=6954 RepID=A0A922I6H1_DERFA|nr:hypothetical protein DERF_005877 [Dermatophagoides farinae]
MFDSKYASSIVCIYFVGSNRFCTTYKPKTLKNLSNDDDSIIVIPPLPPPSTLFIHEDNNNSTSVLY